MKKRFVVCHNPGIPAQDEAFKAWLNSKSLGWWHWLSGSWLVVDHNYSLTVEDIRNAVTSSYPGLYCMITEVAVVGSWAGWGPSTAPKDMGEWMRSTWS